MMDFGAGDDAQGFPAPFLNMNFVLKTTDFALKMTDFVLKMADFVLKVTDFGAGDDARGLSAPVRFECIRFCNIIIQQSPLKCDDYLGRPDVGTAATVSKSDEFHHSKREKLCIKTRILYSKREKLCIK